MRTREMVRYSLIMAILAGFSALTVFTAVAGRNPLQLHLFSRSPKPVSTGLACSDKPAIDLTSTQDDPYLGKLAEYQQACRSFATDHLMIFIQMQNSRPAATRDAAKLAATLKEFNQNHITPVVVAEPVTDWGLIDFKEFESGFYDDWTQTFFKQLRADGVSDGQLGVWVPFPEANLPYWNHSNATPSDFAAIVNRYLGIAKQEFPSIQGSVLLNSATYANEDFNWENGEYISLLPYVKGLDKTLVTSFGLQGFPWMPAAGAGGNGVFDAGEYLNFHLADEAATALGTKQIWFNTGTFAAKYTDNSAKTVTMAPDRRADILAGVLTQAEALQQKGYHVSVNMFDQDKSNQAESTDWSYWHDGQENYSDATATFTNFAHDLRVHGIDLWLFDARS